MSRRNGLIHFCIGKVDVHETYAYISLKFTKIMDKADKMSGLRYPSFPVEIEWYFYKSDSHGWCNYMNNFSTTSQSQWSISETFQVVKMIFSALEKYSHKNETSSDGALSDPRLFYKTIALDKRFVETFYDHRVGKYLTANEVADPSLSMYFPNVFMLTDRVKYAVLAADEADARTKIMQVFSSIPQKDDDTITDTKEWISNGLPVIIENIGYECNSVWYMRFSDAIDACGLTKKEQKKEEENV